MEESPFWSQDFFPINVFGSLVYPRGMGNRYCISALSLLLVTALAVAGCAGALPPEAADGNADEVSLVVEDEVELAPAPQPGPCDLIEDKAHAVWGPKILDTLDFSVKIYEGDMHASDAELAVTRLNDFTSRWIEMRTFVCAAGGPEMEEILDCLDHALMVQKVIVTDMRSGVKMAFAQAQSLPETLKRCEEGEGEASDMKTNPF